MKPAFVFILFLLASISLMGTPRTQMSVEGLFRVSDVVVVIRPTATRFADGKPDSEDTSFGNRDLKWYQALETTCDVVGVLKGSVVGPLTIFHFTVKGPNPEFNGSRFMFFHLAPTLYKTFPSYGTDTSKKPRQEPYAWSQTEFLAFLRKLPDGRYVPQLGHYHASASFRLLSVPENAERYYVSDVLLENKTEKK